MRGKVFARPLEVALIESLHFYNHYISRKNSRQFVPIIKLKEYYPSAANAGTIFESATGWVERWVIGIWTKSGVER